MIMVPHLEPAYGRDYKSVKTAKEDFDADKDFSWLGHYINKSQLIKEGYTEVNIRYDRLRKVTVVII